MRLTGDLHTHTTYSHGKATIEENILRAIEVGLKKIVISDHGSGHFLYGVKRRHWIEMRNAVNSMREKYPNIEILLGIEANVVGLDGNIDIRDEEFKMYDVVYVGYHYGIIPHSIKDFVMFYCLNALAKVFPILRRKAMEVNTDALIKVMEKHPIFMITHPGAKIPINIDAIARKAAELNIVLEVNASHGHLTKEEIIVAKKYNVKFAVNSDSHLQENIGSVDRGLKAIEYASIPVENIVNVEED
ncbi:PHP domain-containing protein [Alkalibaculum sp. M08DMB]|uniref:PHP domain-containing protein n=1 Tax=Alkalibaculum sporogenes TaxID=2655001 RepID=A0A6A7KA51_9FIRM|nr:PHP domain-containing protein [Alkalibaculum sporogenes]MPW26360.1 PHP domain-containing protein [Alkalibaculum sporogenes]